MVEVLASKLTCLTDLHGIDSACVVRLSPESLLLGTLGRFFIVHTHTHTLASDASWTYVLAQIIESQVFAFKVDERRRCKHMQAQRMRTCAAEVCSITEKPRHGTHVQKANHVADVASS